MIDTDVLEVIDEDEYGELVKVDNDIFDDWRLLIYKDGSTYMLADEQGMKPDTMEEALGYIWINMTEWAEP